MSFLPNKVGEYLQDIRGTRRLGIAEPDAPTVVMMKYGTGL